MSPIDENRFWRNKEVAGATYNTEPNQATKIVSSCWRHISGRLVGVEGVEE